MRSSASRTFVRVVSSDAPVPNRGGCVPVDGVWSDFGAIEHLESLVSSTGDNECGGVVGDGLALYYGQTGSGVMRAVRPNAGTALFETPTLLDLGTGAWGEPEITADDADALPHAGSQCEHGVAPGRHSQPRLGRVRCTRDARWPVVRRLHGRDRASQLGRRALAAGHPEPAEPVDELNTPSNEDADPDLGTDDTILVFNRAIGSGTYDLYIARRTCDAA